jgi:3',5'-cyclic-AMP phosphodiesterase
MTTLLAHLTDLHIRESGKLAYNRIDTETHLKAAVQSVLRLPQLPHAVVISGDLVDFGRADEYAHLSELLEPLHMPIYLLPGNHDERAQLRKSFPEHSYLGTTGFVQYTVKVGNLRLIALDTITPGQPHGELCSQRLGWLAEQLDQYPHEPVVIAMHHPPFATLIGHMDAIGLLAGAAELEALVSKYPNVERIVCGHLHRAIDVRFGGTIACTTPSPAHQVCLNLDPQAASAWSMEPPAFRLLALPEGQRLVSHLVPCGVFDGPHPFHDAGGLID